MVWFRAKIVPCRLCLGTTASAKSIAKKPQNLQNRKNENRARTTDSLTNVRTVVVLAYARTTDSVTGVRTVVVLAYARTTESVTGVRTVVVLTYARTTDSVTNVRTVARTQALANESPGLQLA
jgi:hypothetical protein